jgi:hypothetical protein
MTEAITGFCLCGQVHWKLKSLPESATACNCTACRRYAALWAYGHEGEDIEVFGESKAYSRNNKVLEFHFCPNCGCIAWWRGNHLLEDGRRRIAVNLRLTEPETIYPLLIDHFDGLDTFDDLPHDGRCIKDMWF